MSSPRSRLVLVLVVLVSLAACERRGAGAPPGAPVPIRPEGAPPEEVKLQTSTEHGRAETVFSERAGGIAEVIQQDQRTRVTHNGATGKAWESVGEMALSRDGRRCAYAALERGKWRVVADGAEGAPFDAIRLPIFSPDGAHLAYQAMRGERWLLVVDGEVRGETKTRYLDHAFGGDSSRLVFVDEVDGDERGRLVVADLALKRKEVAASGVSAFAMNDAGTRVAATVVGKDGKSVVALALDRPARIERGGRYDEVSDVVFGVDGGTVAYYAERGGARFAVHEGREVPLGDADLVGSPVVIPSRGGMAGLVSVPGGGVRFREPLGPQAREEASYDEAGALVYSRDGRFHAYAARRGETWFLVLNGKEGPPFDRVVSPVFRKDGAMVAYRVRKNGARFVVVVGTADGAVRLHAQHEQVFPASFTPDGDAIAYGVRDGRRAEWVVEAP
jgi:hypothetical protein